jgi:hypothetical protein
LGVFPRGFLKPFENRHGFGPRSSCATRASIYAESS